MVSETSGISRKEPISVESDSRDHARRSLVAAKDIEVGEEITTDHLALKRPGTGISPTMIAFVSNRKARKEIKQDEIIDVSCI